jgi:hypothetical protein
MVKARAVLALAALAVAACSRPAGSPAASASPGSQDPGRPLPSPVPEVVARVNGEPVRIHQILPMAKVELDRVSVADRDRKKPEVLRHALQRYVERELLLQEALARGIVADSREVDWAYDQMRREHADEAAWEEFLFEQGLNPQSLRAELRSQRTVAALIEQEMQAASAPEAEARDALLARLRAKARIELFL